MSFFCIIIIDKSKQCAKITLKNLNIYLLVLKHVLKNKYLIQKILDIILILIFILKDPKTTIINLLECETLLKLYYKIDENDTLYILKIDAYFEGKTGQSVEYQVYYRFNENNLNKLDLTIWERIFVQNDRSLCKENYRFQGYDENTGSVQCSCDIKLSASSISGIKIDKSK